jgi:C4-dicarboxylate-specific signal transduction histidine kinase
MSKYDIEDLKNNDEIKTSLLTDNHKIAQGINRISIIIESMREMSQKSKEETEYFNIYSTLITSLRVSYNKIKHISNIYINGEIFDIDTSDKDKYKYFASVQKQRIEQVWIIIISNALDELVKIDKFEDRKIDISLSTVNGSTKISFQDNAGGIEPKLLNNIFEPFVSTKESGGIGVGLNIAKRIIDENNAIIEAENKNNGACFTITFKNIYEL